MMQVLNGSLVALVTPMMPDGEIDFDTLNKIIDGKIDIPPNKIAIRQCNSEPALFLL